MKTERPVLREKVCRSPQGLAQGEIRWFFLAALLAAWLWLLVSVSPAEAQFPRIGFSAAADHFVDHLDVFQEEEFTLYVVVLGVDEQTPLEQSFLEISWVIYQTCCGANLFVRDAQYNPDFSHVGRPVVGVQSTSEVCVDEPIILLATLTLVLDAPEDGSYQASCGPFGSTRDCDGGSPLLFTLPMVLNLTGATTPGDQPAWSLLKSYYR